MSWPVIPIEKICVKVTSGGTPSRKTSTYYGGTIAWVKTKEVKYNRIYDTEEYITIDGLENSSAKLIPPNSVIIAMYGDGNTAGRCAINKIPVATNQACCNLVIDPNIASYEFVYYYLKTQYKKLVGLKAGGGQQNLNAKTIREFIIPLPPLTTQKLIASVLSAYDDLIENNLRRIQLLEEAARCQYSILMENSSDFEVFRFNERFDIINGFAFKSEWYKEDGTPILRTRDYSESLYISMESPIFIKEELAKSFRKYELQPYDVMLIMVGASLGKYGLVLPSDLPLLQNQNQWAIREKISFKYLMHFKRFLLEDIAINLMSMRTGAARDFFRASFLSELEIRIPPKEKITEFHKHMEVYMLLLDNLRQQNKRLKQSRDILLPRFLNGKIDVSSITTIETPITESLEAL